MDVFVQQLKELTKPQNAQTSIVSDHCRHVAIKLLRRFKNGTRGALELRYLLEDLLSSLPNSSIANDATSALTREDPYKDLRAFANLFTGQNGVKVPLNSKPKRPASIDAAGLVSDTKRSKVDAVSELASLQKGLADVQSLYDLFNDVGAYPSSNSSRSSISQLLSQALSAESTSLGRSATRDASAHDTGRSSANTLDVASLHKSVNRFLPPPPRGQALRDRTDALFSKADGFNLPKTSNDSISSLLDFLEGLTDILARLCAPIRDAQVKAIKDILASSREYVSIGIDRTKLDKAVKDGENQIQKLVQDMQHDLHLFNLGITVATTNEEELRTTIRREAMEREKKVIMKLYGDPLQKTKIWVQGFSPSAAPLTPDRLCRADLARCLVEALFKPQPVSVHEQPAGPAPPSTLNGSNGTQDNVLPPILHMAAKHLFVTQNRLQAFTILATLNTLVPPSLAQCRTISGNSGVSTTWSERVWVLLTSAMLDDNGHSTPNGYDEGSTHVKLANLADEVVQILRETKLDGSATTSIDEEKVRSSVDRMLRLEDRVFALLHGRLKNALMEALVNGQALQVKGFSIVPLPVEMSITSKQLTGILDWECECWNVE
ncbi:hypothetical protein P389DRAFT_172965 [Cystobasidium minutum MCA 4210]|uniref:uncharacterized protein n=1 Tax=Cystobasidium minutum MCA 4210 TaxID=1397322 RepID=UPI0034CD2AF6|eukprot:jgi/Rhomi1/172965/fgenesh1_kg.5_\